MDLKDKIIEKQDAIIKHLNKRIDGEYDDLFWTNKEQLESELQSLRSQLQEKEPERTVKEIIKPFLFTSEELGADDCYRGIHFISEGRAIEAMEEYRNL